MSEQVSSSHKPEELPFGRRKTDHMSGKLLEADGRYYIQGEHFMEINRQNENMKLLLEATRALMSVRDINTLLTRIMDHVTRVMKAERSSLFLIDHVNNELWSRVAQGTSEIRIPAGKGIVGHVVETGKVVNIPDVYEHPNFRSEYDLITGFRTKSILCVPVKDDRNIIIGSLEVLNREDGSAFNEEDEQLLEAFVSLASTALVNARAYEKLHDERAQLEDLIDSARALIAELDQNSLLELILLKVTRVMKADRSSLFLLDKETGNLVSRIAQGASVLRVPIGEGIVGHTAKTGETVHIKDAYSDPRFNPDFDRSNNYITRSILCTPVRNTNGDIMGAIEVLNRVDGASFTQKDRQMLEAFASLAGVALTNARIHEELLTERANLESRVFERTKDLELSRRQSDELLWNILPRSIASELKEKGIVIPRRYETVSVLFSDFKDFSKKAITIDENRLISELDRIFRTFDDIILKHGLEKIKTIGDSYMTAGGIPEENSFNAIDISLAALEILNYLKEERRKESPVSLLWDARIGIHTGPVIAGIVGKNKFAYDIWGPTVNTASRIESEGETDVVSVSVDTYKMIQDYFVCEYRGVINAKNIGDIEIYRLRRLKPEYARDPDGVFPNELFFEIRSRSEK